MSTAPALLCRLEPCRPSSRDSTQAAARAACVSAPPPFGGNQRAIIITLDPDKLQQYQMSPDEAIAAVSKASLVMPSGNMWTGKIERIARTNAALGRNLSEL